MRRSVLSEDRERLLAALWRARGGAWSPLTATQEGIWLAEQLDPGESGYHDTAVLRIDGPLSPERLRRALEHAQTRHEALRGRVIDADGEPRQVFDADRIDWQVVDLGRVGAGRLDRVVSAAAREPFDLPVGPLWRARLVRLADTEHVFVLTVHHLIADGWSHGVLLRSVLACYAEPPGAPGRSDYAAWLADRVRCEREATEGAAAVAARLRAAPYRFRGVGLDHEPADRTAGEVEVAAPEGGWTAFDMACRRAGTTRFMALTGLFAAVLARADGQRRVLLSAPLAGRYDAADAELLGCLISVVPIEVDVDPLAGPHALVDAGTRAVSTALGDADVPYREVVRAVGSGRGDDPLTNVGVEEFNAPSEEVRVGPLRVEPLPRSQVRLRHDLTLTVPSLPGRSASLLYPVARWSVPHVTALAGSLSELVTAATRALAE